MEGTIGWGDLSLQPMEDSSASGDETDEETIDPVTLDDDNPLPGGSSPLHGGEHGSSSQAAVDFLPEDESDEPPPHCPFLGTAGIDGGNTTFTFAELGVSTEQYSSAPIEAYIPMSVEGLSAVGAAPEGNPPSFDDGESPPLEIDALSGHDKEWPAGNQPGPYSVGDDFWNFLLGRVRAVMDAENPPPTEAIVEP
ncbi:hypothetical protein Taro_009097 [Colocasia esculenta]|uniref:Uncharacterized protein n=1 Tax=Colocasia esculenta TaxID=4460 RepID=A0A843U5E4_COLES|nr:hypothetical protein [Colocasia esculenta]